MEKDAPKEEFRDSLGQPNPAHDMQLKILQERDERRKKEEEETEAEPKKAEKKKS